MHLTMAPARARCASTTARTKSSPGAHRSLRAAAAGHSTGGAGWRRASAAVRGGEHSGRRPSGRQPLHCTSAAYNWYFLFPFLSPKFTIAAGTVAAFLYIKKKVAGDRKGKVMQTPWKDMEAKLRKAEVRSLTAFESKSMVNNKDYVLVDVRPAEQFATRHPRGAVNVPLFMPAQMNDPVQLLRMLLLKSQGLTATTENPHFVEQMEAAAAAVPQSGGIILVDDSPLGSLNRTPNVATGTQSRALVAAYLLLYADSNVGWSSSVAAGAQRLLHSEGGVAALYKEGFPQEPRPGLTNDDNVLDEEF